MVRKLSHCSAIALDAALFYRTTRSGTKLDENTIEVAREITSPSATNELLVPIQSPVVPTQCALSRAVARAHRFALYASALCTSCAIIGTTAEAQNRVAPPATATMDSIYRAVFAAWNVPGFAVAIVQGDSVLFAQGYGVRERGRAAAVDARTVFYTASVTKAFTAASLGALADDGKLRATDAVQRHVPAFALADSAHAAQLTILDLLGQRTAVPRADLLLFSGLSDSALLVAMRALAPSAALRGRLAYNNQMYQVLGHLVAQVGGQALTSFMEARLLTPLQMRDANAGGAAASRGANAASPHGWVQGDVRTLDAIARAGYGGGALNASVLDLTRWVRMLHGRGTLEGTRVLSEGVVGALMTPQVVGAPMTLLPGATVVTYGLGGFVSDYRGHLAYSALGQGEGWSAAVVTVPAQRTSVIVLANMHGTLLPQAIVGLTLDRFLGLPPRDWVAQYVALDPSLRAPAVAAAPSASAVVNAPRPGRLAHPVYGNLDIGRDANGLTLTYGSVRAALSPANDSIYVARWHSSAVTAVLGPSRVQLAMRGDSVIGARLELGSERITFTSAPARVR